MVTVPVRGIRLHLSAICPMLKPCKSYCPREGYKVASKAGLKVVRKDNVTVPVRGIRLHPASSSGTGVEDCYCPREGYKVASSLLCLVCARVWLLSP